MRKIKILAIHRAKGGVSYHRVLKPMKALQRMYPEKYEIHFLNVDEPKKASLPVASAHKFDFIYFNTMIGLDDDSPLLYYLEKVLTCGAKIVMDIDDHYEYGKSVIVKSDYRAKHSKMVRDALMVSDFVTTTTETYRDILLQYNPRVYVFPNFIDASDPQCRSRKTPSDRIRIGITGSSMHKYDVQILKGIPYLLKKDGLLNRIQFVLCGYANADICQYYERILTDDYRIVSRQYSHQLKNYDVVNIEDPKEPYRRIGWLDIDRYMTVYNELDILLAPLEDTVFNSVKSPLKYLEATCMDTIFIGSDVPAYNKHIQHDVQGFLCSKQMDFYQILKSVIMDWDKTRGFKTMRYAAKRHVHNHCSLVVVSKLRNQFFSNNINDNT